MKQLNTLLENVRTGGLEGPRVARQTGQGEDADAQAPGRDHVDAINQMFAEFELAYHNQFHKAYAREGSIALAKKYWLSCLARFSPQVILRATRETVSSREYLPSLSCIISACDNAMSLFGLPAPHDAYVEACCAPLPKSSHNWSHPAVYHAGRATDWFALANTPEAQIYPLFEYHYRLLCNRVMNGEHLDVDNPPALTETTSRALSPEENRSQLNQLRGKLKL